MVEEVQIFPEGAYATMDDLKSYLEEWTRLDEEVWPVDSFDLYIYKRITEKAVQVMLGRNKEVEQMYLDELEERPNDGASSVYWDLLDKRYLRGVVDERARVALEKESNG